MHFMASQMINSFRDARPDFAASGVEVLAISRNEIRDLAIWKEKVGYPWNFLVEPRGGPVFPAYANATFLTLLVGADGLVEAIFDGYPKRQCQYIVRHLRGEACVESIKTQEARRVLENAGRLDLHVGTGIERDPDLLMGPVLWCGRGELEFRAMPRLDTVHLLGREFLDRLNAQGFSLREGSLGENILTRGIDLEALPAGAILQIGEEVRLRILGQEQACRQLDRIALGLADACHDFAGGETRRRGSVAAEVVRGGKILEGFAIQRVE